MPSPYCDFLHLVRKLRLDQCLRPYDEENDLGFAKVGLELDRVAGLKSRAD